LKFYVNET